MRVIVLPSNLCCRIFLPELGHPSECHVKLYIEYVKGNSIISLPDLGHTRLNFVYNDKSLPYSPYNLILDPMG